MTMFSFLQNGKQLPRNPMSSTIVQEKSRLTIHSKLWLLGVFSQNEDRASQTKRIHRQQQTYLMQKLQTAIANAKITSQPYAYRHQQEQCQVVEPSGGPCLDIRDSPLLPPWHRKPLATSSCIPAIHAPSHAECLPGCRGGLEVS